MDIVDYNIPVDASIFYLANPFGIDTYITLFDKIYESYCLNKRKITIIIFRPVKLVQIYLKSVSWLNLNKVLRDETIVYGDEYKIVVYCSK